MWPTNLLLLATYEHRRKVVEPPSPGSRARDSHISPHMPVIERPLGAELHSLPAPSRARRTEPQEAPPAFRCVGDVKDGRRGEAQQYRTERPGAEVRWLSARLCGGLCGWTEPLSNHHVAGKACGLDPSVTRRTTAAAASVLVITAHPHRTIEANGQHARPLCKDEQHTPSGDVSILPDRRATAFA